MSKFFATGDSSDESDEIVSDEEELVVDDRLTTNRFIYSSSESEDEGKRVVRSERDKRHEDLNAVVKQMRNHSKIQDWVSIVKDFDALQKSVEKSRSVLIDRTRAVPTGTNATTSPFYNIILPTFVLDAIYQIDEQAKEAFSNKEAKKKMSGPNAKALNTMKSKIKKFTAMFGGQYEKFAEDPKVRAAARDEAEGGDRDEETKETSKKPIKAAMLGKKRAPDSDEESDSDSDESSDDDAPRKRFTKKSSKKHDSDDSDESDDDDEDSDEESDDDDSVDLSSGGNQAMFTREFWVKKHVSESESESDDDDAQEARDERRRKAKEAKREKAEQASVERALKAGVDSTSKSAQQEMNPEQVIKKLKELIAMRGKRGTDKVQMIADLKLLAAKATEPAALLKVRTTLASALFDVTLNRSTHMPAALWQECHDEVLAVIELLRANPMVRLSEDEKVEERFHDEDGEDEAELPTVDQQQIAKNAEEKQRAEDSEDLHTVEGGKVQYVLGNLFSYIQLLFIEYRKAMQAIDWHSDEYITRLRDETTLEQLIAKAQDYYKNIGKTGLESSVTAIRLEIVYYRYRPECDILRLIAQQNKPAQVEEEKQKEDADKSTAKPSFQPIATEAHVADGGIVGQLATFLYKHGSDQSRVRALLMHVYYLALHNNYQNARDMLLMSHINETVQVADIKTQVLFNRAIGQLGLCAFRVGEFRAALDLLSDLVQSNRLRELIAQGSSYRWNQADQAQVDLEKKRQLPVHMHMQQDTIEAVHLIAAMIEEVPNLAQHGQQNRRRVLSKAFRRILEAHQRQAFTGPPEHTRDFIMAATKAMRAGDWERCMHWLTQLRMWSTFDVDVAAYSQAKLTQKIKEETLKTYLLSFSQHFASVSLDALAGLFSLDEAAIQRVSAKLMATGQLSAQWDSVDSVIVIADAGVSHSSRLQRAALAFADKNTAFMEQNERMFDSRSGFMNAFGRGKGEGASKQEPVEQQTQRDGGRNAGRGRGGRGGRGGFRGGDRSGRGRPTQRTYERR